MSEATIDPKQILIDELKKEGLNLAEDAAKGAARAIVRALPKFAAASENKIDDLLIPVLPVLEPYLIKMLDGIDGEKDEE